MQHGKFIVIEGPDGSGTTTQTTLLKNSLLRLEHPVLATCEPSDGPIGILLRKYLRKEIPDSNPDLTEQLSKTLTPSKFALLFAADRIDHLENEILPALQKGIHVISDRYDYSSVTYQALLADLPKELAQEEWVIQTNARAIRPDLTLVLDIDPQISKRRREQRGGEKELFDDENVQTRLIQFYQNVENLFPNDAIVHILSNNPVEKVAQEILDCVTKHCF